MEKDVYNIENQTTSPSTVTSDDPKSPPPREETIEKKSVDAFSATRKYLEMSTMYVSQREYVYNVYGLSISSSKNVYCIDD